MRTRDMRNDHATPLTEIVTHGTAPSTESILPFSLERLDTWRPRVVQIGGELDIVTRSIVRAGVSRRSSTRTSRWRWPT